MKAKIEILAEKLGVPSQDREILCVDDYPLSVEDKSFGLFELLLTLLSRVEALEAAQTAL
jgi:hypothetical protein